MGGASLPWTRRALRKRRSDCARTPCTEGLGLRVEGLGLRVRISDSFAEHTCSMGLCVPESYQSKLDVEGFLNPTPKKCTARGPTPDTSQDMSSRQDMYMSCFGTRCSSEIGAALIQQKATTEMGVYESRGPLKSTPNSRICLRIRTPQIRYPLLLATNGSPACEHVGPAWPDLSRSCSTCLGCRDSGGLTGPNLSSYPALDVPKGPGLRSRV